MKTRYFNFNYFFFECIWSNQYLGIVKCCHKFKSFILRSLSTRGTSVPPVKKCGDTEMHGPPTLGNLIFSGNMQSRLLSASSPNVVVVGSAIHSCAHRPHRPHHRLRVTQVSILFRQRYSPDPAVVGETCRQDVPLLVFRPRVHAGLIDVLAPFTLALFGHPKRSS